MSRRPVDGPPHVRRRALVESRVLLGRGKCVLNVSMRRLPWRGVVLTCWQVAQFGQDLSRAPNGQQLLLRQVDQRTLNP